MSNIEFNPEEAPLVKNNSTRTPLIVEIIIRMRLAKTPVQATYIALFLFITVIVLSMLVITSTFKDEGEVGSRGEELNEVTIIGQIPGQI